MLVNPVGGTLDALFWRVFVLVQTTHASHVALQNRFAFKMFDKLGRRLIVDVLHRNIAIEHFVVIVGHLHRLFVVEFER